MDSIDITPHIIPEVEIVSQRVLPFARETVFNAFRDPHLLAQWWGPTGFRNTFDIFEFRPGGRWVFTMHGPDGTDYPNRSMFDEIDAPAFLLFTHQNAPHFRAMLDFTEVGPASTHVHWRMVFANAALRDQIATIAVDANEQNFDRLTAVLSRG